MSIGNGYAFINISVTCIGTIYRILDLCASLREHSAPDVLFIIGLVKRLAQLRYEKRAMQQRKRLIP